MGSWCATNTTATTNQSQTYTPAGYGAINSALQNAQNTAANNPFAQPVAPVAGFSQMQNLGFGGINSAQGMANPYYQQAGQQFQQAAQAPNVSQFYNPMASAVNAQLQNTFGMQNSQNTGQLTQAAGGVGADRIAVGQANLANQQGLAQGQTDAALYQQATQAAQQQQQAQMAAGTNFANLGTQAENTALGAANSQLTAGGQQQQLQQAQLNAPYQQQLAALAFPYQQAQWLSGQVGALAPALGGTTTGTGTTTTQSDPSMLNSATAGVQAAGSLASMAGFARGGATEPLPFFGGGGAVYRNPFASGGATTNPYGAVPDEPINAAPASIIPTGTPAQAQTHMPSLNLNPSAPSQATSGSSGLSGMMNSLIAQAGNLNGGTPGSQIGGFTFGPTSFGGPGGPTPLQGAGSFGGLFNSRGGAVGENPFARGGDTHHHYYLAGGGAAYANPYADGGTVSDDDRTATIDALRLKMTDPFSAAGPSADSNPYRMDPGADAAWRASTDAGSPSVPLPQPRPAAADAPVVASDDGDSSEGVNVTATDPDAPSRYGTYAQRQANAAAPDTPTAAAGPSFGTGPIGGFLSRFMSSPNASMLAGALSAVGAPSLGNTMKIMGEQQHENDTVAQAAAKLKQEADFHRDEYTKLTAAQQAAQDKAPTGYETTDNGMRAIPGGPADPAVIAAATKAKGGAGALSPEALDLMTDQYISGDHSVVSSLGYGTIGAANRAGFWNALQSKASGAGLTARELTAAKVDLQASTAGATTAARSGANIDRAVIEAQNTFPLAEKASAAVPRGNWVPINKATLAIRAGTSDPALAAFVVANQGAVTAYAAAMGRGSPVTTVHAQQHAEELLSTAPSHQAYVAALRQMDKEMTAAQAAPGQVRQNIRNQITGQAPAAAAPPPAAAPSFTGRTASGPGGAKLRETSDGQWVQ